MKKILGNPIIVFFFLITFSPLGIFLMFSFTDWTNGMKMALATVFGIGFIVAVVMTMNQYAQQVASASVQGTINHIKMTM